MILSSYYLHLILPAFFGRQRNDEPLDIEDVISRIDRGLDSISDADGRSTGEGQYISGTLTIEDALLARNIAENLRRIRNEQHNSL